MTVEINVNNENQKVANLLRMIGNLSNTNKYGTLTVKLENKRK